jgi:hypothetical protein
MSSQIFANVAKQFDTVVTQASERFTDWLEEYLKGENIELSITDKSRIEQLFFEAVHTYITAEVAAGLSYLLYTELGNEDVVKIVPTFLDEFESGLKKVPESLEKKTRELTNIAQNVLEKSEDTNPAVVLLLKDIAEMDEAKNLRATFDAVVLCLMGE